MTNLHPLFANILKPFAPPPMSTEAKSKPGPHAHQAETEYFRHKVAMEQDCTLGAPYLAEIVQQAIDAAVAERTRERDELWGVLQAIRVVLNFDQPDAYKMIQDLLPRMSEVLDKVKP